MRDDQETTRGVWAGLSLTCIDIFDEINVYFHSCLLYTSDAADE